VEHGVQPVPVAEERAADLVEAAESLHLSGWQKFWRLEAPFAVPGLVWNTMMSMSAAGFRHGVRGDLGRDNTWKLPGIGSYVALALERKDIAAIVYAS